MAALRVPLSSNVCATPLRAHAKPNTRANKQPDIGTNATTYSVHPEPHASVDCGLRILYGLHARTAAVVCSRARAVIVAVAHGGEDCPPLQQERNCLQRRVPCTVTPQCCRVLCLLRRRHAGTPCHGSPAGSTQRQTMSSCPERVCNTATCPTPMPTPVPTKPDFKSHPNQPCSPHLANTSSGGL